VCHSREAWVWLLYTTMQMDKYVDNWTRQAGLGCHSGEAGPMGCWIGSPNTIQTYVMDCV
jgi:hypothetical protein